jgi:hypothetical protein
MAVHNVVGDPLRPLGEGRKVIAHFVSGRWEDSETAERISDRWREVEQWHRAQFRWLKYSSKQGDVQWVCIDYEISVCSMIGMRARVGPNYEAFGPCVEAMEIGAAALGADSIHTPTLAPRDQLKLLPHLEAIEGMDVYVYRLPRKNGDTRLKVVRRTMGL